MAVRNVPPTNSYNDAGTATGRRERSFAALYQQARRAAANDDAERQADLAQAETERERNRRRIETLRERVDTMRGEILVRVIQAGRAQGGIENPAADIDRLSTRLNGLRQKLQTEETRLSGKLIDVNV